MLKLKLVLVLVLVRARETRSKSFCRNRRTLSAKGAPSMMRYSAAST